LSGDQVRITVHINLGCTIKLIQAGSYYGFSMAAADFRGQGYDLSIYNTFSLWHYQEYDFSAQFDDLLYYMYCYILLLHIHGNFALTYVQ